MKIRLGALRRVIREAIISEMEARPEEIAKAAEAPLGSLLGRIAFAETRPEVPYEYNTKEEGIMYRALTRFFVDGIHLDDVVVDQLTGILENGDYKSIFHEPPNKIIFRGLQNMPPELLKEMTGLEEITGGVGRFKTVTVKGGFDYKNLEYGTSSWSTNLRLAREFAANGVGGYDVILGALPSDNHNKFISCDGGLYKIGGLRADVLEEKEVLGLGTIRCTNVSWKWNPNNDEPPTEATS